MLDTILTPDQMENLLYGLALVQRIGNGRVTIRVVNGIPRIIEIAPEYIMHQEESDRLKEHRRKVMEALREEA